MDIENIGYSAGSGVIGAILIALGFKSRMDRQDKDVNNLKKTVVYKDTFELLLDRLQSLENRLEKIDSKIDRLIL